ncbi:F-box domain-containing protein [Hirschfeldia incana]|nr:F-box domain-containing protein [Hirschfeldia incana]
MEIEEKHNPNSHERLRPRDTPKSWSELPLDLVISVFKSLSFANFQRAKSVCSSWHSASRQCVPNNQIHWLVLFPEDNNNNSCTLFNPEEENKRYRTNDLGLEFAKSFCIETYRSWLLMCSRMYNLYIVNLFTHERIDLPPVEAQHGVIKMERALDDDVFLITSHNGKEYKGIRLGSPVLWIDKKTREYVVLWELRGLCVVYSRKGDTSWNQIPETSSCCDMVYKDSKLYFLSLFGQFRIFDFSGDVPQETFQCGVIVERFRLGIQLRQLSDSWSLVATKLVVTVTGEVLKVEKLWKSRSEAWTFRVFKFYSSGFQKKHNRIYSLGDESMLLDQGITVLADDTDGFIKNSVYFSVSYAKDVHGIFLFNLETQKTEPVHKFDCSSVQFSRARWFFPSFRQS